MRSFNKIGLWFVALILVVGMVGWFPAYPERGSC